MGNIKNIVIIGNGISGITAARHIRKRSDDPITIISAETDHFFSRTALMYIYMGHMKYESTKPYEDWFWGKNNLQLLKGFVKKVDTDKKELQLHSGKILGYDILIIATGSKPNKFGWPGEDLKGVQGLYSYQDLENMQIFTRGIRRAVVVGGGLIGIEMVEMLLSREIPVTFLVREASFWDMVLPSGESAMVNRHIREHEVDLRLETELEKILPDDKGRARAVISSGGEEIPCQFVGLAVGVHPNIGFLKESKVDTDRGILVNPYFETNIPDVYAIGDCVQYSEPLPGRKPIEQVWYTGRIHGETVALTITGKRTPYQPGPWFNSAKFFDIEYQVYGNVSNVAGKNETSVYWEDQAGKRSIRLVYAMDTRTLLGVNLMGVRFRHQVCDNWIRDKISIDEAVRNLNKAFFDAEFSDNPLPMVTDQYNRQNPDHPVHMKKSKSFISNIFS
ncbi:MAG: NAD(P)/FAD-dependent oxidoreductase [Cyclobacteriaceae bacterium]|nr:NAD(P)/FAD-dependent oxidoreductase [Cyclobacteriaceae bacterium]